MIFPVSSVIDGQRFLLQHDEQVTHVRVHSFLPASKATVEPDTNSCCWRHGVEGLVKMPAEEDADATFPAGARVPLVREKIVLASP